MKKAITVLLTLIIVTVLSKNSYCGILVLYGNAKGEPVFSLEEIDKKKISDNERNYCLDLLRRFENIVSNRDYDSLTKEEKEVIKEFFFAFPQTNLCTVRLWNDLVKIMNFDPDKVPEDKLSLLIAPRAAIGKCSFNCDYDEYIKDPLPFLNQFLPECSSIISLSQKIKCFVNSGVYTIIGEPFPSPRFQFFSPVVVPFLIKITNPEKVDIFVYKAYFILTYRVTYDRFMDRLEKFKKNPNDKPLCIYSNTITCPWLHLEKSFWYPSFDHLWISASKAKEGGKMFLYIQNSTSVSPSDISKTGKFEPKIAKLFNTEIQNLWQGFIHSPEEKLEELKSYLANSGEKHCLIEARKNKVEDKYIYIIKPEDETCENLIDEVIKAHYEYIRSQYIWFKKELKPRGYIN